MSFGGGGGGGGGGAAAAPAATPTMSGIFQGSPIPQQPTAADTSTQYPLWLQQYTYNLANSASNLANTGYTPFPGPQVAAPSAPTQQAESMALGNVGSWQPGVQQGGALTSAAAAPVSASQIQNYMNPYMGNVIGGLQSAANTNLFTNVLPRVQDQFVSAGQAASPQQMQATNNAIYQSGQALDQSVASALGAGYQGALTAAQQQQATQLAAGAQTAQLGALTSQLGAADVGQVAATGQQQDIYNQANINAAMNNFYSQQQWPYQNLAFASNILRGQPVASNTMTVGMLPPNQSLYTASPLQSFIGGTLQGSSLFGATPTSTTATPAATTPAHARHGGYVRGRRRGVATGALGSANDWRLPAHGGALAIVSAA